MYVFHSILLILTGVISTTRNVKIQFEALASDAAGVRMANGAYSAGTSIIRDLVCDLWAEKLTKPWNSQQPDSKEEVEEEEHHGCNVSR